MTAESFDREKWVQRELERMLSYLPEFDGETRELLAENLREKIEEQLDDPAQFLKYRLESRWTQPDGKLDIPADELEDRAIRAVLMQLAVAKGSLELIVRGDLSCSHAPRYAGGVVSEGNRIFTAEEVAFNGLQELKHPRYSVLEGEDDEELTDELEEQDEDEQEISHG